MGWTSRPAPRAAARGDLPCLPLVGVPCGAEVLRHSAAAWAGDHPDLVWEKGDVHNAYNDIKRGAVMRGTVSVAPRLALAFAAFYGRVPTSYVYSPPGRPAVFFDCGVGVLQGCPAGMALFCLGQAPAVLLMGGWRPVPPAGASRPCRPRVVAPVVGECAGRAFAGGP